MRIFFITDINQLAKAVEKYLITTKYETYAYSKEGLYIVDHAHIYKLNIEDGNTEMYENYCSDISITTDETILKKEIANQIPPEHIIILKRICIYKLDPQSNIKLIIEFNSSIDKIIDYYFEVPDTINVNDVLFKKKLCEFLNL
jgi:hypothetical protein